MCLRRFPWHVFLCRGDRVFLLPVLLWGKAAAHRNLFMLGRADDLEAWYMGRVLEIEELSGLVSHALSFAALAIARGCVSDESAALHADLELLEALVYDCALDLSLADLGELSAKARVALLLADCTPDTIVGLIRTRVAPFFDVQAQTGFDLLYAFLVDAAPHNLGLAAQVVRASRADAPTADRLIVDEIALLKVPLPPFFALFFGGYFAYALLLFPFLFPSFYIFFFSRSPHF